MQKQKRHGTFNITICAAFKFHLEQAHKSIGDRTTEAKLLTKTPPGKQGYVQKLKETILCFPNFSSRQILLPKVKP